jgi:hypothetical protein
MDNKQLAKKVVSKMLKMNEPNAQEAQRVALMFRGRDKHEYTRGGKGKECLLEEVEAILNRYNREGR